MFIYNLDIFKGMLGIVEILVFVMVFSNLENVISLIDFWGVSFRCFID